MMEALQLHQTLVAAGMPEEGGTVSRFLQSLCQRLGVGASAAGGLKQLFFDLLSHLITKAPSLGSSWIADYLAACSSAVLSSSNPDEAYVLQPQSVLAWCQQSSAQFQERVGAFLRSGPASPQVDSVLELQQTAQALLSVAHAVQAVSSSAEVQQLAGKLQSLQQATRVLQVLEQLQQQLLGSPACPSPRNVNLATSGSSLPNGTPLAGSTISNSAAVSFGQQPLFRPGNAACRDWQQQLSRRRAATTDGCLFLDDLLQRLQQQTQLPASSSALTYPYQDVLTCVDALFLGGGSTSTSTSSSSSKVWHAKLAVLLYYLLDGGWLSSTELFAQGFQLPLTEVQQWQCHQLLDAACSNAAGGKGGSSSTAPAAAAMVANAAAALDRACQLLVSIACPSTPFRFVEALLQAGRPATALAVQRARCSGAGSTSSSISSSDSSSLDEAEVLLRVQLGCDLLAEAFCDMRRHCSQVSMPGRSQHTNVLVRQLTEWALTPSTAAAAAADATAAHMQQQLHLHEQQSAAATAAAGAVGVTGSVVRQQQLLQLPLNAAEEAVVLRVLRERMAAGKTGGHLLPLYLLQRGRSLEALSAYAAYKASPAGSGAAAAGGGVGQTATDADAEAQAATSRALLHKRLDAVMAAAAAALPPALRAATAAPAAGGGVGSDDSSGSAGLRSVLQGLGSEARRLQGEQGGTVELQRRGVEPPCFLAPLLSASIVGSGQGHTGTGATPAAAAAGRRSLLAGAGTRSGGRVGAAARDSSSRLPQAAAAAAAVLEKDRAVKQPLLFEEEIIADAGPKTVKLGGGKDAAAAGKDNAADVVPLLFGTPAPASAAGDAGKTPGIVRGGLFDTPAGGGVALWANTPATGGVGLMMSEADFERQVRFATPQAKAAGGGGGAGAGGGGGVFTYTGQRSLKRMRRTPGNI